MNNKKKLGLNKKTIRVLTDLDNAKVVGGAVKTSNPKICELPLDSLTVGSCLEPSCPC